MQMKEKSNTSKTQQGSDCTISVPSQETQCSQKSAIVESVPISKKTILRDKSLTCETSTQKPKLSKTLEADSTTKEKVLTRYWNDSCLENSSKLWLPTKTVLQDLDSNSLSRWSSKTVEKSWFSTNLIIHQRKNLHQTFSISSTFSRAECMDLESMGIKSKKIRIYPKNKQKSLFNKWLGASRFVYNETIKYLKTPGTKANWKGIKGQILADLPEWSKEIPYQIKSMAVYEACKAVKKAKGDFKKTGEFCEVKFKSKKNPRKTCYIPKGSVTKKGLYPRIAGELIYKEELPDEVLDSKLTKYYDQWYVCIPQKIETLESENQGKIVSLDPGVRTFQTFYSEDSCGKIAENSFGRIHRLCFYLDDLLSRASRAKCKQKRNMLKAASKMRIKIKNLIQELHYKTAYFLVQNFDVILLPSFETQEMSKRTKRKIRKKSVRAMLTYAHYRFKQFLKFKAFEFGKTVLEVCEAYTSKTVSWTGEEKVNLGGAKFIKSKSTNDIMDRDYNGARGIFLRALVDSPDLFSSR